ncbi:uncharacterized protein LOC126772252 isoform X5 [Nymphalis io]|uniref:uncharacterized protein LOC126772252 isoform X1 n=1 Tax=Inachis io TaxID=171585 RepID=UPI00216733CE|nr:uncharacterized protein LOC126772252 isoform X1 [Nymphalis io]XP_050348492.1 uncharacterized protein LOC126772252 isoform X5 [Nymphalis io]
MAVRGCLLYVAFVGLQVSSTLAAGTVPLTCFLQNQNFFNIFNRRAELTSNGTSTNPPQFDTMRVKGIDLNKDGWSYRTTNLEYSGLNNAVLDDFGFNFNSNITHLTFHTDMVVTCQYLTDGLLFSQPVSGAGSCIVHLDNIQFGMIMPFNFREENGQQFINLRNYRYFYDVRDGANFTLTNLYFGDKESSSRMHHLLNYNWKFITERYSPIFIDAAAEHMFDMFRNNLLGMPLKGQISC